MSLYARTKLKTNTEQHTVLKPDISAMNIIAWSQEHFQNHYHWNYIAHDSLWSLSAVAPPETASIYRATDKTWSTAAGLGDIL